MKFLWPVMLWLAVLLPLLAAGYLWLLRRRRAALTYSNLGLVRAALAQGGGWRRKVPPLLLLAAVGALVVASARPVAVVTLPSEQQTVVFVMDVSGSMSAEDVAPNRLRASQVAARNFALDLPANVRVGVVAYGGTAHLVQAPTLRRDDVIAAIDRFQLQPGTAIGSGIVVAMATLFPDGEYEVLNLPSPARSARRAGRNPGPEGTGAGAAQPVPAGSYASAAIVLLTDGQNTSGPDPMDAAQLAADRGVRIFTVGFGTPEGATIGFEGWSMHVRLDEDTLRKVANLTGGRYFQAATGHDLQSVYAALKSRLVFENKETEVTVLFADLAALLVIVAVGLSVFWFARVG